jgi:predicted enzyme related to lactoylglutathione lyase
MTRPVHFEILAEDPEKVATFYRRVLGWEIASWGQGEQSYWLVDTGPEDAPGINGGIMHQELPQAVINTMEVASLADTLDKVKAAGGKIVHGPNEVTGVGMHAYCADPEGILFGLMEPLPDTNED